MATESKKVEFTEALIDAWIREECREAQKCHQFSVNISNLV